MVHITNLGYPRIGPRRELKTALEKYWSKAGTAQELLAVARTLRENSWRLQKDLGVQHVPSNDFSLYDHVLDTAFMVGAIPTRYKWRDGSPDLETYFAMARGSQTNGDGKRQDVDVPAMEMTKWFDTNYHYIVPEFEAGQKFSLLSQKPLDEFLEAKALGIVTRPVILGPVTFLSLGKVEDGSTPLALIESLLPVYDELLKRLAAAGAEWVQIDEPCLVLDSDPFRLRAAERAYKHFAKSAHGLKILLATYFADLRENLEFCFSLPVHGLHLDLARAPQQLDAALERAPANFVLSLGLVDGRNVWKTDLSAKLALLERAAKQLGSERVMVAPSASLMFSPVDVSLENALDADLRQWLAFARQKLDELVILGRGATSGRNSIATELSENQKALAARKHSAKVVDAKVQKRVAGLAPQMFSRKSPFAERWKVQQKALNLPLLPTTTIGSFPQTKEIRQARSQFKSGKITPAQYDEFIKKEISDTVRFQEEIGIDVLVHGESERTDMVEYFGEQLKGVAITNNGWVQSYGSRCVRPPIIYGDVSRPQAMTVKWSAYAKSLSKKPVKGMITGPVTILQWAFVRDDQPRLETCQQIALALRDEVLDLESAGIHLIQIDEPAVREGLPLHAEAWDEYLGWAVKCFKLSASGVKDETQIHTHMCYSQFNDIIDSIAALDADVISIETSRSQMRLLDAFTDYDYPNEIGPGVFDIHSPRVPPVEEMANLIRKALEVLPARHIWVNPDCGLKTRHWQEVKPALKAMVDAAKLVRSTLNVKRDVNSGHEAQRGV